MSEPLICLAIIILNLFLNVEPDVKIMLSEVDLSGLVDLTF